MGHLDIAFKEFAKTSLTELLTWLKPQVQLVSVVEMPPELPATLRHVDVLARVMGERDEAEMRILECQAQPDKLLHRAMLLRAALVHVHYGLPVSTTVLALTPAAAVAPEYVYGRCGDRRLVHLVEVRRLYEEPAEAALREGPEALLPLVPVMRPKDGDHGPVLEEVLRRIAELEMSTERKRLLLTWAATFASVNLNRQRVDAIFKEVARRRAFMLNALQDLPLMREIYEEGIEKGIEKGAEQERRSVLSRIYENRLGPLPAPLHQALDGISGLDALDALFPLFFRGSAEEIAARLQAP